MYRAEDILDARENRVFKEKKILEKYLNTLIVVRANYPGINKDNFITREIVSVVGNHILNIKDFKNKILFKEIEYTADGPIFFIVVNENFLNIKKICINIEENHKLGRCVDIDVYNEKGKGISRRNFGLPSRKCFLCSEDAHVCVRSRKHSEKDVIDYIEKTLEDYRENAYE
ncbi:citrate lyase holo-[acyl-carrier protein] synthase [Haloimpatiens sp. FM7315]|uniref:citrate lyase holo-[acyl-carrier protein] synthase n=1 Tax=Haloimpatiens sp. FM7315 TaxID=3298609 RepID=UPI00370AD240